MPRILPFDEAAMPAIAAELGTAIREAPFRLRDAAVYECRLTNQRLGAEVRLLLWPSLARVDAYLGDCAMVFKRIEDVAIYPGVEVTFRRADGAFLFVTSKGIVATAS